MSIEKNGTRHHCVHDCSTLAEHLKRTSAEFHVDRFENEFDNYVNGIASVIVLNGATAAAKPAIQALVNAYHDLGKSPSPLTVPSPAHFNTLQMFVLITGASLAHSGEDEDLKILKQAHPA